MDGGAFYGESVRSCSEFQAVRSSKTVNGPAGVHSSLWLQLCPGLVGRRRHGSHQGQSSPSPARHAATGEPTGGESSAVQLLRLLSRRSTPETKKKERGKSTKLFSFYHSTRKYSTRSTIQVQKIFFVTITSAKALNSMAGSWLYCTPARHAEGELARPSRAGRPR